MTICKIIILNDSLTDCYPLNLIPRPIAKKPQLLAYHRATTLFSLAEQAHNQIHCVISGPMRALADAALATVQAALESYVRTLSK
jgi:hypothetical protein